MNECSTSSKRPRCRMPQPRDWLLLAGGRVCLDEEAALCVHTPGLQYYVLYKHPAQARRLVARPCRVLLAAGFSSPKGD